MGHAGERHDIQSQETHSGRWVSFRQPVLRAARERHGRDVPLHLRGEPGRGLGGGRVLDRAVAGASTPTARWASAATSSRPTGRARSSPSTSTTAGSSRTRCPACPRPRRAEGLTAARLHAALRRVPDRGGGPRACTRRPVDVPGGRANGSRDRRRHASGARPWASRSTAKSVAGFPTPSRKLEIYSRTLEEWGWAGAGAARLHPEPRPPRATGRRRRARWCCCRPSGCPRSSTRAAATRST